MQELWVFCVLVLWLTANVYFLYCLERRKPWAVDTARAIALFEGSAIRREPASRNNKTDVNCSEPQSSSGRLPLWPRWI